MKLIYVTVPFGEALFDFEKQTVTLTYPITTEEVASEEAALKRVDELAEQFSAIEYWIR